MSLILWADVVIKATILLGFLFALSGMLRRAPAALRHLVWGVGLTAVLLLPVLSLTLPWRIEILPFGPGAEAAVERSSTDASPAIDGSGVERARPEMSEEMPGIERPNVLPRDRAPVPAPMAPERTRMRRAEGDLEVRPATTWAANPGRVVLLVWLAGLVAVAGRLLIGMFLIRGITGRGEHLESGRWKRLKDRATLRLGVGQRIRLIKSRRAPVPFGTGLLRPTVVVPESAEGWSDERRLSVLLHEIAHLRRRDFLAHLVAHAACAVYWFHPLVWMSARRLRVESERACDDLVLRSGTRPSQYANHLIEIVRASGRSWALTAAQPMARRSEFEGRLLAILEPDMNRQGPRLRSTLSVVLAIALTAIPLAAMAPERPSSEGTSEVGQTRNAPSAELRLPTEPGGDLDTREETSTVAALADGEPDERLAPAVEPRVAKAGAEITGPGEPAGAVGREEPGTHRREPPIQPADGEGGAEPSPSQASPSENPVIALLNALSDPEPTVRKTVVRALGQLQDTLAVRALMTALRQDGDPEVREAAAWALGEMENAGAIPALEQALAGDDVAAVRLMAARALGEIEDPRAITALGPAVNDPDPKVRQAAIRALGKIESPDAIDALSGGLEDEDPATRKLVVWALGQIEDSRAVPALSNAVRSDADAEVRQGAARALGEIEHGSAVDPLISVLSDEDERVRATAVWALGQIEDPRGVSPLARVLLEDADPEIRGRAARALGEIEDRRAVESLVSALRDEHPEVRAVAAWALGEIQDPAAAPGLAAALGDSELSVRRRAALALGEMDLPSAPQPLITALGDEDSKVRLAAVLAVAEIGDPAAVPGLANLLDDPDVKVRRTAVRALGEIESPEAYRVLVGALKDEDPEIRKHAARALGNSKGEW